MVVRPGARSIGHGSGSVRNGVRCPLERQAYVDEGSNRLDAIVVLGVVEKVSLAALVRGMPLEDVELWLPRIPGP